MSPRHRALQPEASQPQQAQGDTHRPRFLTQRDICKRFAISDETWRRWRKSDPKLPTPVDLPGWPRWREADIDAYEQGRTAGARHYFGSSERGGRIARVGGR